MNEYKQLLEKVSELAEKNKPYTIKKPEDVIDYLIGKNINKQDKEIFRVFYLNTKNKILKEETITGTISRIAIYIRNIIKNALLNDASALIVAHNHPSGEVEPSANDLQLTQSLKKAADLLDIKVLDHIITAYGNTNYFSFSSEGMM